MNDFETEIASIGVSPFNKALEDLDVHVTSYDDQQDLVNSLQFRLDNGFKMPTVIVCCAGICQRTYDDVVLFCNELSSPIPVMVYDQAFSAIRRREAKMLGAREYMAEPISDERMSARISNVIEFEHTKNMNTMASHD